MRLKNYAIEQLDARLDIRHFFNISKNLQLLLWLMLNKQQLIMFQSNHSHALKLSKKDQSSDDSDSSCTTADRYHHKLPTLEPLGLQSKKKTRKAIQSLNGYQVGSELDQKLLMGMFDQPRQKKSFKKYLVTSQNNRNTPQTQTANGMLEDTKSHI